MPTAYLGLGSNRGRSEDILSGAVQALGFVLERLAVSRTYRTKPRDVLDQADFLNMAVKGETALDPIDLLDAIQAIEARFGRDRGAERPKGERSLDIDILAYGDLDFESERLIIPHPRLLERKFALLPLLELEPGLRDPRTGLPLAAALDALPDQGIYYSELRSYSFLNSDE